MMKLTFYNKKCIDWSIKRTITYSYLLTPEILHSNLLQKSVSLFSLEVMQLGRKVAVTYFSRSKTNYTPIFNNIK